MDTLTAKVKELGGVQFLESLDPEPTETLAYIEKVMGAIPESRTVDFISKFGNSRFLKLGITVTGNTSNTEYLANNRKMKKGLKGSLGRKTLNNKMNAHFRQNIGRH